MSDEAPPRPVGAHLTRTTSAGEPVGMTTAQVNGIDLRYETSGDSSGSPAPLIAGRARPAAEAAS